MVLTLLFAVPALTAAYLLLGGRSMSEAAVRMVALVGASVALLLAVIASIAQPSTDVTWVASLGLHWRFDIDGVSIPLVLLTAVIGVLVVLHSAREMPDGGRPSTFLGSLLLVEAGALATFTAKDAVLFFVAFEIVLVPMWVLITRFGDPHDAPARRDAGQRFILYTAVGSTLMLVGILLLVVNAGTSDLGQLAVSGGRSIPASTQTLIAALLVLGLAVKVPVFPLHTWLPPAHTTAPTAGSVVLAAVLLKMGTYGLVRLPAATLPEGFARVAPVLGVAGVIGIIWGGLICLVERDLKRLIAYSSVAHMGFVALGLSTGTRTGLQAALFANIAHGVISALLFFVVGGLKARWGSVKLDILRPALRETAPHLGFTLILGLAAGLGLPGLAGFWGEFMAMYAAWTGPTAHPALFRTCAIVAALGAALAAAYGLRVARQVWVGDEVHDRTGVAEDTRGAERAVFAVLSVAVVTLGVVPGLLLSVTDGAVSFLVGGGR